MQRSTPALVRLSLLILLFCGSGAAQPAGSNLEQQFAKTVKPFLAAYCIGCHGGSAPAAMFDLRPYTTMTSVVQDFGHWTLILDKLTAGQMPPKVMKQPPAEVRTGVIDWIRAVRTNEARKNAGDPGPVLARRLSNAEYNYTVRDLTGVDIRPTREFPVDPANTAGFDNSGESLSMSPALLNKYLQAARSVADHMVLNPDGFDFAPHPMLVETDRDRYAIQRIVSFYKSQPTDYADYFEAAWRYKHRVALGMPRATLQSIALESKLSAKYLPMIWAILEEPAGAGKPEVGPVGKLQSMWKALPAPPVKDAEALRAKCVEMRNFAARIRKHTAMQFASPIVRGLPAASQPIMSWKLLSFNNNRRKFDSTALRNDTDPLPQLPEIPPRAPFRAQLSRSPTWAPTPNVSRRPTAKAASRSPVCRPPRTTSRWSCKDSKPRSSRASSSGKVKSRGLSWRCRWQPSLNRSR
jgi:hypothetical protein